MLRRAASCACCVVAFAAGASGQVRVGAGAQSCGQWVESRRPSTNDDVLRRMMILSWVQGYVFGHAESTTACETAADVADRIVRGDLPPDVDRALAAPELLKDFQTKFGTVSGLVFDPPDGDAIQVWLDDYCRTRPLDSISKASGVLLEELKQRKKPV